LARQLGMDQPFCGVPIPTPRELPQPRGLAEFAAGCVKTIRAAQPQGPYSIGGWSDWGVLGYEVAQQLIRSGSEVTILVLFDSENPRQAAKASLARLTFAEVLARLQWLLFHARAVPHLPFREAKKYIGTGFKNRIGSFRDRMNALRYRVHHNDVSGHSDVDDTARVLRHAVLNYQPVPYPGQTLFFRAAQPPGHYRDSQNGWSELIAALESHEVPGGHLDMLLEPNVQIVADRMESRLIGGKKTAAVNSVRWLRPTRFAAGS